MVLTLAQELESSYIRIRDQSSKRDITDIRPHKYFEWIRLKKICQKFDLEETYQNYSQRIYRNYLKSFMRLHCCLAAFHSTAVVLGSNSDIYYFYDSVIYFMGCVLVCIWLLPYLSTILVRKFPFIPYVSPIIASLTMAITDCLPCTIGYALNRDMLSCCYTTYTISCIYLFMPMKTISGTITLALFTSIIYCCNSYYCSHEQTLDNQTYFDIAVFIPEFINLVAINIVGILFRVRNELAKRRMFLTKSLNIEENLLLKYAKAHEHNLLLTIIPPQIAKKIEEDIKIRIDRSKNVRYIRSTISDAGSRKLFIEPHYNVSILFADVVNYTYLTTTLDVKDLVATLHELFQRFDSACEEFNCMRIKFLGDCYYCVAGVPQTHPYHAVCCVELGRAIINHIVEVRTIRSLDIDMRIGIHSGNILSGIIGTAKWQYDIWSKDVDIASRLEQTGVAGRVHVSEATLNLIEGYYEYEDGTEAAKNDPLLQKQHIRTFLIKKPTEFMTNSNAWNNFKWQYKTSKTLKRNAEISPSRNFAISDKGPKMDYKGIRTKANAEIARKVKTLPICKLSLSEQCFTRLPRLAANEMEEYKANRNISVCCLWYDDWHWETMYNNERDEFFKMSVLGAVLVLWCTMAMQATNKTLFITPERVWTCAVLYTILGLYSIIILVISWFRTICNKIHSPSIYRPRKRFVRFLHRLSMNLENWWHYRMIVYMSFVICLLSAAFVHLMTCNQYLLENDDDLIHEFISGGRRVLCFNSWAVSDSVSISLAVIMTFSHIPHCLASTVGFIVIIYYVIVVFLEFSIVYESSLLTNRSISAEYSHIWSVSTAFFIYLLMNRHVVFISRINAYVKWNVDKKRQDAHITNESIKILLHNILPSHVVNIYLSKRLRNEAYYEQHEFVAVMFATIIYARSSSIELRLLNEIICDFDEVLSYYKGAIRVEKIKVANWSYMAACGFNVFSYNPKSYPTTVFSQHPRPTPNLPKSESTYTVYGRTSSHPNPLVVDSDSSVSSADDDEGDESIFKKLFPLDAKDSDQGQEWKDQQRKRVLNVMAHFGLDLLRSMEAFNISNQLARGTDEPPIKLRIGISCGEVMAGVVGSSQAHYDIWGNAVNMASRMDSTGVPGRIQVTDEAADMLSSLNIACTYRGMTYVKGRDNIPTYFVEITSDMNFQPISSNNSFATFRSWFG